MKLLKADTIFSLKDHTASVSRTARLVKAKIVGYHASKWIIVAGISLGLVSLGTLQTFAGYTHHPSGGNIHKTVRVHAGNNNHFGGNSHSNASVNNAIHVSVGGQGGSHGGSFFIKRGNGRNNHNSHNNNNHNNGNKTVKRVVRKNINTNTTNTTNVTVNKTFKNIDIQKSYNPCSYDWNCNSGNGDYNYDNNYDDNYNGNYSDSCGCQYHYNQPTQTVTPIKIINNNTNSNENNNNQSVDVQQPTPYYDY
jgi:hypothetical protein